MLALELQSVSKHFGSLMSLDQVSLKVESGEFFGLLGPNGAGKTTLINIVAGLSQPSAGQVTVMGHNVQTQPGLARANLGVVPQELVFDPFFTVREALRFQSGYFGLLRNDNWIDEILHELNLTEKADVNMRALSGGMKRRVLVAQALVHKPPVIILDEPTAGVDVELRQILWKFIARLNSQGHTVVLTTHYLEEAEALCNRVAIMRKGRLLRLDTTSNLLAAHTKQTAVFVLAQALPSGGQWARQMPSERANELVVGIDCPGDVELVLAQLRQQNIQVLELVLRKPDLEDVFVEIVGQGEAQ